MSHNNSSTGGRNSPTFRCVVKSRRSAPFPFNFRNDDHVRQLIAGLHNKHNHRSTNEDDISDSEDTLCSVSTTISGEIKSSSQKECHQVDVKGLSPPSESSSNPHSIFFLLGDSKDNSPPVVRKKRSYLSTGPLCITPSQKRKKFVSSDKPAPSSTLVARAVNIRQGAKPTSSSRIPSSNRSVGQVVVTGSTGKQKMVQHRLIPVNSTPINSTVSAMTSSTNNAETTKANAISAHSSVSAIATAADTADTADNVTLYGYNPAPGDSEILRAVYNTIISRHPPNWALLDESLQQRSGYSRTRYNTVLRRYAMYDLTITEAVLSAQATSQAVLWAELDRQHKLGRSEARWNQVLRHNCDRKGITLNGQLRPELYSRYRTTTNNTTINTNVIFSSTVDVATSNTNESIFTHSGGPVAATTPSIPHTSTISPTLVPTTILPNLTCNNNTSSTYDTTPFTSAIDQHLLNAVQNAMHNNMPMEVFWTTLANYMNRPVESLKTRWMQLQFPQQQKQQKQQLQQYQKQQKQQQQAEHLQRLQKQRQALLQQQQQLMHQRQLQKQLHNFQRNQRQKQQQQQQQQTQLQRELQMQLPNHAPLSSVIDLTHSDRLSSTINNYSSNGTSYGQSSTIGSVDNLSNALMPTRRYTSSESNQPNLSILHHTRPFTATDDTLILARMPTSLHPEDIHFRNRLATLSYELRRSFDSIKQRWQELCNTESIAQPQSPSAPATSSALANPQGVTPHTACSSAMQEPAVCPVAPTNGEECNKWHSSMLSGKDNGAVSGSTFAVSEPLPANTSTTASYYTSYQAMNHHTRPYTISEDARILSRMPTSPHELDANLNNRLATLAYELRRSMESVQLRWQELSNAVSTNDQFTTHKSASVVASHDTSGLLHQPCLLVSSINGDVSMTCPTVASISNALPGSSSNAGGIVRVTTSGDNPNIVNGSRTPPTTIIDLTGGSNDTMPIAVAVPTNALVTSNSTSTITSRTTMHLSTFTTYTTNNNTISCSFATLQTSTAGDVLANVDPTKIPTNIVNSISHAPVARIVSVSTDPTTAVETKSVAATVTLCTAASPSAPIVPVGQTFPVVPAVNGILQDTSTSNNSSPVSSVSLCKSNYVTMADGVNVIVCRKPRKTDDTATETTSVCINDGLVMDLTASPKSFDCTLESTEAMARTPGLDAAINHVADPPALAPVTGTANGSSDNSNTPSPTALAPTPHCLTNGADEYTAIEDARIIDVITAAMKLGINTEKAWKVVAAELQREIISVKNRWLEIFKTNRSVINRKKPHAPTNILTALMQKRSAVAVTSVANATGVKVFARGVSHSSLLDSVTPVERSVVQVTPPVDDGNTPSGGSIDYTDDIGADPIDVRATGGTSQTPISTEDSAVETIKLALSPLQTENVTRLSSTDVAPSEINLLSTYVECESDNYW